MSNPFKTFEKQIAEEKSEIRELKKAYDIVQDHLVRAEQKLRDKDKLIGELADEFAPTIGHWSDHPDRKFDLIRRAREAIK
jgi:hypothetical protein